ncbi:MAG: hypothetical protein RLY16_2274 [Bacteroidota bacterium]|jgi:hypothetical protein
MKNKILGCCLLIAVIGCNQLPKIPTGGPCSFKTDSSNLQLVKLLPNTDSSQFDAQFQFVDTVLRGTTIFSFSMVNHRYLSADEIKQKNIGLKTKADLIQLIPVTGDCAGGDSILLQP